MLGFAGIIPSDSRAITVPISNITAVAGFLNPGDYVDVMLVETNGEGLSKGEILFQNVLLLAINRNGTKPDPNAPPPPPKEGQDGEKKEGEEQQTQGDGVNASPDDMNMATLALTPPEALELAAKSQHGTIYLAMRPFKPADTFVTDTEYKETKEVPAAAPQPDNSREEALMSEYVAALQQIAVAEEPPFEKSKFIRDSVEALGFKSVHNTPTKELLKIWKKSRRCKK